jgi:hypothetical protein
VIERATQTLNLVSPFSRFAEILDDLEKDPESHGGPPDCVASPPSFDISGKNTGLPCLGTVRPVLHEHLLLQCVYGAACSHISVTSAIETALCYKHFLEDSMLRTYLHRMNSLNLLKQLLVRLREQVLREVGFEDIFKKVKVRGRAASRILLALSRTQGKVVFAEPTLV